VHDNFLLKKFDDDDDDDSEFVHIVDGTLVKCDYRSDLTQPKVDTAKTGSCLYS